MATLALASGRGARLASQLAMDLSPTSFNLARRVARGSLAGLVATTTMTAAMFAFQKSGLLGRMPPRLLTERTLARLGLHRKTSNPTRRVLTGILHYGFGGAMGAIFEVARGALAARRGRSASTATVIGAGAGFGSLVWAASYMGWVPALGLMARPSHDRPGRPTSMVLAHLVFGTTLAAALRAADPRPELESGTAFASSPDEVKT